MASKTQQNVMVFDEGGAASPAAAPVANHLHRRFGRASRRILEQGEQGSDGSHKETGTIGQADGQPRASSRSPIGLSAMKPPQRDFLAPDSTCRGIRVTLDNNNMWNEFFRCKTEMILTQQGSRMFPYCRFRISGLQPSKNYVLMLDIQPLDQSHYTWTGTSWQVAGKAESHITSPPFTHPESPSTGQQWMQNPVSFYKLKLTSNRADKEGNAVLHPMHRYVPRLHVVQTEKAAKDIKLNGSNVATFTFQQTEFMAVTAYQNSQFAQLKVDYNPFAKGLKEDANGSRGLKLKSNKEAHQDGQAKTGEQQPLKRNLKSLLANHKTRNSLDPKPSGEDSVLKASSGSGATVVKDISCKSQPEQKLIAELIREAHVSLKRCTLESPGASQTPEQTNTKTTPEKGCSQDVPKDDKTSIQSCEEISPQEKTDGPDSGCSLHLLSCSDKVRTEVVSGHKCQSKVGLEHSVKRPALLTLPALALFLKQHSTKKKVKSNLESPPNQALPDVQTGTDTASTNQPSTTSCNLKPNNRDMSPSRADHMTTNVPGKVIESIQRPSSPTLLFHDTMASPGPKGSRNIDCVRESGAPEPLVLEEKTVLANDEQSLSNHRIFSSALTTSSSSPMLSPLFDTPLASTHVSNTLSSESKSVGFLPDSPCSPFGFEPLSPASSPEPLPSLPVSFELDLDSVTSEPPERLPARDDSCPSVFKWHTVLPPTEPYVDSSFAEFQPTSTLSLGSSLLPSETPNVSSQSPSNPQSQTSTDLQSKTVDAQTLIHSDAPAVDALSFQENEQPLPFPGELSPLALPLTLSPTFSSLDGDGLSPTPSIADLVHFFSTDDHLGMGMDFPSTDSLTPPCPPDASGEVSTNRHPHHVPMVPSPKDSKCKKRSRRQKLAKTDLDQKMDGSAYTAMQPNLEEVEEQLFISFTSKEALKLHIADSEEKEMSRRPVASSQVQLQQLTEEHTNEETIAAFEKVLLKDVKMMKHQQIIHPVLQEVGLKMNLLDPTLSIDLQYLGVRLPIPPPGTSQEPLSQELPPLQSASTSFVSRTGKTTDLTQIKGWREKFTPSEVVSPPSKAEVCTASEQSKKNLSAFCSDMLDQYLESEAKLIDERATSFSQPSVELPPLYELPASSNSYVRPLNSVLKKPTSDLISGFIPPSKRTRVPIREHKANRKGDRKQKSYKPEADHVSPQSQPAVPTSAATQSHHMEHLTELPREPPKPDKAPPSVQSLLAKRTELFLAPPQRPALNRRKEKIKSKTSSKVLSPPWRKAGFPPLESDSEVDGGNPPGASGPSVTQGLLRQKDLEDGVIWGGRPRTFITEERATIALTSLFTLMGFVCDNPTAPIQLPRRPAAPCLNDFCRLGCVCSSLAYTSRISHCGRPQCMLGCSCLKQKVVLLKNLDGSDSSPSHHGTGKKKKRKRMKMAYILKEADSVSQPADRVRTLWKRDSSGLDPEPIHSPEPALRSSCTVSSRISSKVSEDSASCARVRRFAGKVGAIQQEVLEVPPPKPRRRKFLGRKNKVHSGAPQAQLVASSPPQNLSTHPKPSRRLTVLTECRWKLNGDRDYVLKKLCETMAQDRLDKPFWARKYHINPISQTVEETGTGRCIHYKVLISRRDKLQQDDYTALVEEEVEPVKDGQRQAVEEAESVDDWQREVEEETEPVEEWQREVMEEDLVEDWQRELNESDLDEQQVHDGSECLNMEKRKHSVRMALPFLTGISPAGFLSASKQTPDGYDPIQVNGKLYPLAKIQLGEMGALHPANRLAAYLTGRVLGNKKPQALTSLAEPPQSSSVLPPVTVTTSNSVPTTYITIPPPPVGASGLPAPPAVVPTVAIKTVVSTNHIMKATMNSVRSNQQSALTPGLAPPTNSQRLMVPPPRTPIRLPVLPCPQPPLSSSVRMVLRQVHTPTGIRYYRKPDGKLVQLIPVSQLRAPSTAVKTGSATSVLMDSSNYLTASSATTRPTASSSTYNMSGLKSFTVTKGSGSLSKNGMYTLKILPIRSTTDPVPLNSQNVPAPPTKLTTTNPLVSAVHSVKPGIKAGTVTGDCEDETTVTTLRSEVTPSPTLIHPASEPARDLVDLDIICVDDHVDAGKDLGAKRIIQEVNLLDSSSSETENSSDFTDDSSDDVDMDITSGSSQVKSVNSCKVVMERMRRHRISQLVDALKCEVQLDANSSTLATLNTAIQVIEQLRTSEKRLKRKKMVLAKRRDRLFAVIVPSAATGPSRHDVSPETQAGSPGTVEADGLRLATPGKKFHEVTKKKRCVPKNNVIAFKSGGDTIEELNECQQHHLQTQTCQELNSRVKTPQVCEDLQRCTRTNSHQSGNEDDKDVSCSQKLCNEQAPPTPALNAPSPDQRASHQLEVSTPRDQVVTPTSSNNEQVVKNRLKTTPNILCRRKNLSLPGQDIIPADTLTVVATALPGQSVLTLSPLMAGQLASSSIAGAAPINLNLPSATNQHMYLAAMPLPPTTANLNNLFHLAPPTNTLQPHTTECPPPGPVTLFLGSAGSDPTSACKQKVERDGDGLKPLVEEITSLESAAMMDKVSKVAYEKVSDESCKGAVLTPPPLLHMKVGGAKTPCPPKTETSLEARDETSWRPMPRLVPLGIRGNPPN
ncbi:MAX dimerization protein MGA a isoform X2 [Dunckerocampus dactyliophorus]|uniref:MAX dimerization protein MGA a isoform X2 n=1 Tax=Dunckerocampus dactyliophorus TaxID=161453 RepID=UPI0024071449|nr:MAX dimerization protein MGA a isoform X2 [Dunckerocampus dactyliophorus]